LKSTTARSLVPPLGGVQLFKNMRTIILTLFIFFCTDNLSSQEQEADSLVVQPNLITRISLIMPGISIEKQLSDNYTFIFNLWIEVYDQAIDDNTGKKTPATMITLEPRFYTSLKERQRLGKESGHYSGSYIGFPIMIGLNDYRIFGGPAYGFQNKIGDLGFWNIGLGFGYMQYKDHGSFNTVGYFSIGITLL
jgi:hypothetical protein